MIPISLIFAVALSPVGAPAGFAQRQSAAPRVRQARINKQATIEKLFADAGISYPARSLYLRAFKYERQLEVWAADGTGPMKHIVTYPVCSSSGELGPKRRRGDLQVPEGFYTVNRFNAWSNFHLSMGINYPNRSDRRLGYRPNLGGDIFIHGDCVTIGCIPIEDEGIEELYIMALDTFLAAGAVPMHIFPARMDEDGMRSLHAVAAANPALRAFWASLRPVYQFFEEHRQLPRIRVDPTTGIYRVAGSS